MSTISHYSTLSTSLAAHVPNMTNALGVGLTRDEIVERVPAVFASGAHERVGPRYTFIPTERVLDGLLQAGFVVVDARQARSRGRSLLHARHVLRVRRRYETVALRDSIPEIVFLNSHDGTTAYQLRVGLFRVVCTNGLVVSNGSLPGCYVPHRGDVVDQLIRGALELSERFPELARQVERMEHRLLFKDEQMQFAERAITLRYPDLATCGMVPSQLLTCRRATDTGEDLWTTLNKVQENLLAGGLRRFSASGRLQRTRRISAIRESFRINGRLWDLASEFVAA